mmetsp:Transcript_14941/g.25444  ORF Transcript_14941/g.25444 Transcript_14941/m.25444 type:complete len:237 (-) Transcript_14941:643-1353(-)
MFEDNFFNKRPTNHRETLNKLFNDEEYGLDDETRRKQIKVQCYWALFEGFICLFLSSILVMANEKSISFIQFSEEFGLQVQWWIIVQLGIYCLYFLRRVVVMIQWKCIKDPRTKQARLSCFTCMFLNTFETGWFIYGNTLFFSKVKKNKNLYRIMLAIVVWGYITMLFYLISLLGILFLVYGMYSYGIFDTKKMQEYEEYLEQKENVKIELDNDFSRQIKKIVISDSSLKQQFLEK